MEEWQISYIKKHKLSLIKCTTCDVTMLVDLHSKDIITETEFNKLKQEQDSTSQLLLLYTILQKKVDGYKDLINVFKDNYMKGPLKILVKGLFEMGLHNIKLKLSGKPLSLGELLEEETIKKLVPFQEKLKVWEKTNNIECVLPFLNVQNHTEPIRLIKDIDQNLEPRQNPRKLVRRSKLIPDIFTRDCDDIFIFTIKNTPPEKFKHILKKEFIPALSPHNPDLDCRFFTLENENDWAQIVEMETFPISSAVHLISYESSTGLFALNETLRATPTLLRYIHEEINLENFDVNTSTCEDDYISQQIENAQQPCKMVFVAKDYNTGKSLLANLATRIENANPKLIVLRIVLKQFIKNVCIEKPERDALDALLRYVSEENEYHNILQEILKKHEYNKCGLVLCIDAFSHAWSDRPNHIIKSILKELLEEKPVIKLFIMTSKDFRQTFEEALEVIAFDIFDNIRPSQDPHATSRKFFSNLSQQSATKNVGVCCADVGSRLKTLEKNLDLKTREILERLENVDTGIIDSNHMMQHLNDQIEQIRGEYRKLNKLQRQKKLYKNVWYNSDI